MDNELKVRLKSAAENVVRFSSLFQTLGTVLNILNYIFPIAAFLILVYIVSWMGVDPGWLYFAIGIPVIAVSWLIGWFQIAFLRGLSAFFLMRGLSELNQSNSPTSL